MSTGRLTLISLGITGLLLAVIIGFNYTKKDEAKVQPPAQVAVQSPVVQPSVAPAPQPPEAPVVSAPAVSAPASIQPAPKVTSRAPRVTQPAREPARPVADKVQSPFPKHDDPGLAPQEPVTEVPPKAASVPPVPVYVPPPPPPRPTTAVLPAGTPLDVRLMQAVSSGRDNLGDTFEAQLERDLEVDGKLLAKRGSLVTGKISDVVGSGRVKGRARMSVTLTEIKAGAESYPIQTSAVSFEAESSTTKDAVKVGGAAGLGAIIGAIAGGAKGAAIGAVIGGGAGTAGVMATKGKEVELANEQRLNFTLERPVQMKIQSFQDNYRASDEVRTDGPVLRTPGSQDMSGAQRRIEGKLSKFQAAMPGWLQRGGDPQRIRPLMDEVQLLMKAGEPLKAEEKLDEALAIVQSN